MRRKSMATRRKSRRNISDMDDADMAIGLPTFGVAETTN